MAENGWCGPGKAACDRPLATGCRIVLAVIGRGRDPRPRLSAAAASPGTPGFVSVIRDRSFGALSGALFVSLVGDQFARVALSVLVYARTGSGLLTGGVYALSFLPAVLGGPLLNGLADRLPRRQVMVGCDLVRMALVLVMALPEVPLGVLFVLIAAVTMCEAPFDAARGALVADVLTGERYPVGNAISQLVVQAAQVLGFAVAGGLLIALSPRALLGLDAVTFLASAALVRVGVSHGLVAAAELATEFGGVALGVRGRAHRAWVDFRLAVSVVLEDTRLRPLVIVVWVIAAAAVAPEALAVPYAAHLGGGTVTVGLLLAANPVGNVCNGLLVARLGARRRRLLAPLALLAVGPLLLCLADPPLVLVLGILLLSGAGMAVNVVASTSFVQTVAADVRGRALGLVGTGLAAGQGIALAGAGAISDLLGPATAVGLIGLLGATVVLSQLAGLQGTELGRASTNP